MILALWGLYAYEKERQWIRMVSCHNHGNITRLSLLPDDTQRPTWHPPHLADIPGHLLLTSYSLALGGRLNCHHGASGRRNGGWQAVNLSPDKWDEVIRRWPDQGTWDGVPFFWCGRPSPKCGRPNPTQRRLLAVVPKSGRTIWIDKVSESHVVAQVELLNKILADMGERPVPLNVPDNVDWDKAPLWPTNPSPSKKDSIALR